MAIADLGRLHGPATRAERHEDEEVSGRLARWRMPLDPSPRHPHAHLIQKMRFPGNQFASSLALLKPLSHGLRDDRLSQRLMGKIRDAPLDE